MDKAERKSYSNHQYQQVIITFSDDTFAVFTGPFVIDKNINLLMITSVVFSEGKEMPNDTVWLEKKDVNSNFVKKS